MIINNTASIQAYMDSVESFDYMIVDGNDLTNNKEIWVSLSKEFAAYVEGSHIDHIETDSRENLENLIEMIEAWGELTVLDASMYRRIK